MNDVAQAPVEMVAPQAEGKTEMIAPEAAKERSRFNAVVWSAEGLRHVEAKSKLEMRRMLSTLNADLDPAKTVVIYGRQLKPQLKTIVTF